MKKLCSLFLALLLVFSLNLTTFAKADTSPNTVSTPTTNTTVTVPKDVKPVKTYTVDKGKSYKLPDDVKQTGDSYTTNNSAIMTVDKTTGRFTAISDGTAYIVATNNGAKRYIKVTVGTGITTANTTTTTSTGNSSALTGYPVSVLNQTASAVKMGGFKHNGVYALYFQSADGTVLGSISEDTFRALVQPRVDNGTLGNDDTNTWIIGEFNKYRSIASTTGSTTGNKTTTEPTGNNQNINPDDLGLLINQKRTANGITTLTYDSGSQELADQRARELADNFSHIRPDGSKASDLGYAEICTTNATAENAFKNYSNSAQHNEIMLKERYTTYTIGYYQAPNGKVYWTVLLHR